MLGVGVFCRKKVLVCCQPAPPFAKQVDDRRFRGTRAALVSAGTPHRTPFGVLRIRCGLYHTRLAPAHRRACPEAFCRDQAFPVPFQNNPFRPHPDQNLQNSRLVGPSTQSLLVSIQPMPFPKALKPHSPRPGSPGGGCEAHVAKCLPLRHGVTPKAFYNQTGRPFSLSLCTWKYSRRSSINSCIASSISHLVPFPGFTYQEYMI